MIDSRPQYILATPMNEDRLPPQGQLLLPLLETIADAGGQAPPRRVYDALAERMGLPPALRSRTVCGGAAGRINAWERQVRNARQAAAARGLIENDPAKRTFNLWEITERAAKGLRTIRTGLIITVYETASGSMCLCECETAVELIADESVDLILTSPPFPLATPKGYGNRPVQEHIDWLLDCARAWKRIIAGRGSLVIHLADVWTRGAPTLELYQERLLLRLVDELGYRLAQKFYWHNPAKLPAPAEWVTVRRVRVTPSVEPVFWLSPTDFPKANNRNVLRPYSESMRKRLKQGGDRAQQRPSGHRLSEAAFSADCGGSIPHTLLNMAHSDSNTHYLRTCRERGLPIHPARMPEAMADFFINLLTEHGDTVLDPFGGSNVTGASAARLGRRWMATERVYDYVRGSVIRHEWDPTLRTYLDNLVE